MKQSNLKLAVVLAVTLAGFVAASIFAADSPRARHVFIISFDQGNPDLIQTNDLPVFKTMASEGARAWNAYTIVPCITLPSHVSMLTGVGPQAHQVLWNNYEPEKGMVSVPTAFSLAKQRGLVTAMFVAKEKLKHIDQPGSVDLFVWPRPEDDAAAVAKAFADSVGKLKPNLCFIHFRDPDSVGHKFGAYSPEKIQALKECDAALKVIKDAIADAGLADDSVIILTADHGSHDTVNKEGKTVGVHNSTEPSDVTIPWVIWGKGVKKNHTITTPVVIYDTAATALWLLDVPLPESFWGRPVTNAFK